MRRALLIASLLGAAIFIGLVLVSVPPRTTIAYKGKPLTAWFYGARTNFFNQPTRQAAQDAIDALGTNACPFLLANLKERRGNGALYCRLYRALPARLRTVLPYAISGDDIKKITLDHIEKMGSFPKQQFQPLADCVLSFGNPRLRLVGYNVLRVKYETDPAFSQVCRQLLNDAHPGMRLEAAIWLADSAIIADPHEPRLFPILITALESKKERELSLEISGYYNQQQPPGAPGRVIMALLASLPKGQPSEEQNLRRRILTAMYRLERYLSPEQKDRFRQAIR